MAFIFKKKYLISKLKIIFSEIYIKENGKICEEKLCKYKQFQAWIFFR